MTEIRIDAPRLRFDAPEGWVVQQTVEAWGAVRASEIIDGFTPNVVFVIVRVGSTHSLESLSAILLEEIASRYEGLEVRESNTDGTIFDRSVSFRVGSIEIFQYQRLFLLGSGWPEVNWLVQAQASGPIGQEVDLRPVFSPILSSLRVTLDPGEPRVDRISSAGQTLLS